MDIDLRERGFFVNLIRGNGGKVLWPKENGQQKTHSSCPIPSMYGIYTYIWLIFMVNVGKYTIHGSYGC